MVKRRGWLLSLGVLSVFALILPWAVVRAEQTPENMVLNATEATDSIEFNAQLQAARAELAGQYAWASINSVVQESEYSTEPQPMEVSGDACVFGGAGSPGCHTVGDAASATTRNGTMPSLSGQTRVLGLPLVTVSASVSERITTGVRCWIDAQGVPRGVGQQPSGVINYQGTAALTPGFSRNFNLSEAENGEFTRHTGEIRLLGLLLPLEVEVDVLPRWGWNPTTLRAYSEVNVTYRITNTNPLKEESYTARSECGLMMNNGEGSDGPAGMGAQSRMGPQLHRFVEPVQPVEPTSAPGIPTQTGFTTEDTFITDDGADYHLLATRELDPEDRLTVRRVFTAIREDGGVEGGVLGAEWWIYSAEAAGEQVPVLEIELADATVIQVRPNLPGVLLPSPDRVVIETSESEPAATSEAPPATIPEPEEPGDPDEVEDA